MRWPANPTMPTALADTGIFHFFFLFFGHNYLLSFERFCLKSLAFTLWAALGNIMWSFTYPTMLAVVT